MTWQNDTWEVTASISLPYFCVELMAYCRLHAKEREDRNLPATVTDSFVLNQKTCLDFAQFVQKFV